VVVGDALGKEIKGALNGIDSRPSETRNSRGVAGPRTKDMCRSCANTWVFRFQQTLQQLAGIAICVVQRLQHPQCANLREFVFLPGGPTFDYRSHCPRVRCTAFQ
jgi:hypothetical protein